jgi:hypothetical protein
MNASAKAGRKGVLPPEKAGNCTLRLEAMLFNVERT